MVDFDDNNIWAGEGGGMNDMVYGNVELVNESILPLSRNSLSAGPTRGCLNSRPYNYICDGKSREDHRIRNSCVCFNK